MKHIFIVNPTAGNKRYKEIIPNIEKYCKKENIDYKIHLTEKEKHATEIAESYKKEKYIIYACGGDGTVNEVATGLLGSKNMLGILPIGSGNDFYRTLDKIDDLHIESDMGKVNETYFINIASMGFDSEVSYQSIKLRDKVPVKLYYPACILNAMISYKFKNITFKLNGIKMTDKYTMVTICNGTQYGGGIKIAPKAKIDDHLFDVYFVDRVSKLLVPSIISKVQKGKHENDPRFHKRQTDKIIVTAKKDMIFQVDGEVLVGKKFEIKLIKKAVTIYNNKKLVKEII